MDVTGSSQKKNLFIFNDLKRSVDVLGNPWIDGVERAKGIEPLSGVDAYSCELVGGKMTGNSIR